MTDPPVVDSPVKTASKTSRLRHWAVGGLWIGGIVAVLFALIYGAVFVEDVVGNLVDNLTGYFETEILPVALRDGMLWIADNLLPPITPALMWMKSVGDLWNGLFAVAGFLIGIFSIILSLVLFLLSGTNANRK